MELKEEILKLKKMQINDTWIWTAKLEEACNSEREKKMHTHEQLLS